jgi:hypothetical protein
MICYYFYYTANFIYIQDGYFKIITVKGILKFPYNLNSLSTISPFEYGDPKAFL